MSGPTEIWTRIAGFRVQSANHYTIGPCLCKIGSQCKAYLKFDTNFVAYFSLKVIDTQCYHFAIILIILDPALNQEKHLTTVHMLYYLLLYNHVFLI